MAKDTEKEQGREKRPLGEYFEKTWSQVEKSVEEAVARSLSKVKVPRREQLTELKTRLDRVEARISALEAGEK